MKGALEASHRQALQLMVLCGAILNKEVLEYTHIHIHTYTHRLCCCPLCAAVAADCCSGGLPGASTVASAGCSGCCFSGWGAVDGEGCIFEGVSERGERGESKRKCWSVRWWGAGGGCRCAAAGVMAPGRRSEGTGEARTGGPMTEAAGGRGEGSVEGDSSGGWVVRAAEVA
eukprot:scaffold126463_cov21-Tisochrysis_lutea.AAC.2